MPSKKPAEKISLVYLTQRPGGIDLLGESLKHQVLDYELLVIDGFPGRVERGRARAYLEGLGVPIRYYGPPKPHTYPDHKIHGFCNAMNTGALFAGTDFVVFLHDFSWLPLGQIAEWTAVQNFYQRNTIISGIASRRESQPPKIHDDISVWGPWPELCRCVFAEKEEWVPKIMEMFYLGMPVEFIEATNGFEEQIDCLALGGLPLQFLIFQANLHNYHMVVDRALRVTIIDHRNWEAFDRSMWDSEKLFKHPEGDQMYLVSPRSLNPWDFKTERKRIQENFVPRPSLNSDSRCGPDE